MGTTAFRAGVLNKLLYRPSRLLPPPSYVVVWIDHNKIRHDNLSGRTAQVGMLFLLKLLVLKNTR